MRRTVQPYTVDGLAKRLRDLERARMDERRRGDAPAQYVEPDATSINGTTILTDWEAPGWRFLVIGVGDATSYSSPSFDDSGWSIGAGLFGGTGGDPPSRTITTSIPVNSRVWLRRNYTGQFSAVQVSVRVDDQAEVWWNGTYVGSFSEAIGVSDEGTMNVPESALTGYTSHVLAIRLTDSDADIGSSADEALIDARVVATVSGFYIPDGESTDASDVSITDAGGYFSGSNVEAALQELGAAGVSAGSTSLLAVHEYLPSSNITIGSSLTDLDATNIAVTFTAPPSGSVLVRLSAPVYAAGSDVNLALRSGSSTVGAEKRCVSSSASAQAHVAPAWKVTGLTPGDAYTFKLAGRRPSGSDAVLLGGTSHGALTFEVWSA